MLANIAFILFYMSELFSPFELNSVVFKNRIWVSPMCQYSAVDGVVGDWHLVHLGGFAVGGSGLIMAEATAVSPEGRISVACPGLWREDQADAWRRIVNFVHGQGGKIGIQLAHAGRKASTLQPWGEHLIASESEGGWQPVAPSPVAFEGYPVPHELTTSEIENLVTEFASAARRAIDAKFDVIEVHAAHGYLLHEFLSPLSNNRNDAYGGSFENRARFLLEVVRAIRAEIGHGVPLFVRISATDYTDGGWDLESSIKLAELLQVATVDLIDVSSGGNVAHAAIPSEPNYQVPFAEAIKNSVGIAVSAVGRITEANQAEAIVSQGRADAVFMAREFLRVPHWPLLAAAELETDIVWPNQYVRARPGF